MHSKLEGTIIIYLNWFPYSITHTNPNMFAVTFTQTKPQR